MDPSIQPQVSGRRRTQRPLLGGLPIPPKHPWLPEPSNGILKSKRRPYVSGGCREGGPSGESSLSFPPRKFGVLSRSVKLPPSARGPLELSYMQKDRRRRTITMRSRNRANSRIQDCGVVSTLGSHER